MRSMLVALGVLAVWGSVASADVVVLKNGDRVSGIIETLADGKLKMKSDLMGEVTMDLANVQTFSTDEPITLLFKDGTVVHQKIASADGQGRHPAGRADPAAELALADLNAVKSAGEAQSEMGRARDRRRDHNRGQPARPPKAWTRTCSAAPKTTASP